MPRQWLRDVRKAIGLPPSNDVGRLAEMISRLREQVEEQIGVRIDSACVTTMHLVALYYEDLHDAFEYAGLTYITFSPGFKYVIYEISAAYAGYGFGPCSDYKDHDACKQEHKNVAIETVISVLYTRNVLALSLVKKTSAYYTYEAAHSTDFALGHDDRTREGADEEEYWDAVVWKLQQMMNQGRNWQPDKVLVVGDCAGDETFPRVLKEVFGSYKKETLEVFSKDSAGVAAKGAAEFAKRRPYLW